MSYDPNEQTEAAAPPPAKREAITAEQRRKINDELPKRHRVAVVRRPGEIRPQLIIERLPRSGVGHEPRRPVYIERPPRMQARLVRLSKRARQDHQHGATGNKGKRTIAFKRYFLAMVCAIANELAALRRRARKARETFFGAGVWYFGEVSFPVSNVRVTA